jgi:hypothetical protein
MNSTDDPAHAPSSDGGPASPPGGLVCGRAGSSPSQSSEQEERKLREAEHERLLREGTTFHQHAQAQVGELSGGRFGAVGVPHVTGSAPAQQIPQLPSSSPWSGAQPQPGPEPPLGFDNPAFEDPAGHFPASAATGGAPSSAPPEDVAAPPPSAPEQTPNE